MATLLPQEQQFLDYATQLAQQNKIPLDEFLAAIQQAPANVGGSGQMEIPSIGLKIDKATYDGMKAAAAKYAENRVSDIQRGIEQKQTTAYDPVIGEYKSDLEKQRAGDAARFDQILGIQDKIAGNIQSPNPLARLSAPGALSRYTAADAAPEFGGSSRVGGSTYTALSVPDIYRSREQEIQDNAARLTASNNQLLRSRGLTNSSFAASNATGADAAKQRELNQLADAKAQLEFNVANQNQQNRMSVDRINQSAAATNAGLDQSDFRTNLEGRQFNEGNRQAAYGLNRSAEQGDINNMFNWEQGNNAVTQQENQNRRAYEGDVNQALAAKSEWIGANATPGPDPGYYSLKVNQLARSAVPTFDTLQTLQKLQPQVVGTAAAGLGYNTAYSARDRSAPTFNGLRRSGVAPNNNSMIAPNDPNWTPKPRPYKFPSATPSNPNYQLRRSGNFDFAVA